MTLKRKAMDLANSYSVKVLTEAIRLKFQMVDKTKSDDRIEGRFTERDGLYILNISVNLFNILWKARILNISDLAKCSSLELLDLRTFGQVRLDEVRLVLKRYGLKLIDD